MLSPTLLLNLIFSVIILVVMILSFFGLSTNMTANLMQQKSEIGVLRSIGFTKTQIKLLYFYEAFLLVFVSCFIGVIIGVSLGYAMKLQQQILLD
jgi:ABC-type antimicrobial peptide transport system permease subunit